MNDINGAALAVVANSTAEFLSSSHNITGSALAVSIALVAPIKASYSGV